jgi:predicted Zn-dependent peptidase
MKLIEKFKSYNYGATNYVYEFENGLRLIVTQKDGIKDFYAGVVFKAGSLLNNQLNVPQGATHFLEHLMVFSTSKLFKTIEEKKEYVLGSYTRPRIVNNGATHRYSMWTYSKGQIKGKKRIMNMIKGHLDSKGKDYETAVEKQRSIITSERSMDKKEEKDASYNYNKFFFGDIYPEFVLKIDGDLEDIKKTTVEDLVKVRDEISKGENAVVVIQTDKWPDKTLNNDLKIISKYFKKEKSALKYKYVPYINKFKYKHFKDDEAQDVFISYNVFLPTRQHIDYKLNALEEFTNALLNKSCFEYLREDKHLVYKANSFEMYTLVGHNITGIK